MDREMELALVKLINKELYESGVYLEYYQKIDFSVYNENIIKDILHKCKFKDIGNVYDYPDILPQPEYIDLNLSINLNMFQRIAISKKINSIVLYTIEKYRIQCTFLIDKDYLKKFSKNTKSIIHQDSSIMFREIDFKCKNGEYIEISDDNRDNMKPVNILKKKVIKENLVFVENSTIVDVMNDIHTFFKNETCKLYEKLQISYKRGIILYGDPGNGKSAMIREIIRTVPKITKIMINPNVFNITRILSSLIKSLNGKQTIIFIEDIDSLITERNRSEFLNILDGVDIQSGIYFIGTTNYPDQIDPAFMNRSGRFDRTYKIDNPSESTRKAYFKSRNIGEILSEYKVYKNENIPDTNEGVIELFVKYSNDLPMASLKEIMTSTQYILACNENISIEEAVEKSYNNLINSKNDHINSYKKFKRKKDILQEIMDKDEGYK